MTRGKKINLESMLEEMEDIDEDLKQQLNDFYYIVYVDLELSHDHVPQNRVKLYKEIEDLLK